MEKPPGIGIEKETEKDFEGRGQKMADFDKRLDQVGTAPRKKTPAEMLQNPNEFLDEEDERVDSTQQKLDKSWSVSEPGQDSSLNDNDSKNGPAR